LSLDVAEAEQPETLAVLALALAQETKHTTTIATRQGEQKCNYYTRENRIPADTFCVPAE
jgi:hypothetical protein